MRRRAAAAAAAILIIHVLTGCHRKKIHPPAEAAQEGLPALASTVSMADAKSAFQLLHGFHRVEQDSWRWTMQHFGVALRVPAGAGASGAALTLRFTIPEVVLQRLKQVTVSARAAGEPLAPETYTKVGDAVYRRVIPARALAEDPVRIEFALSEVLAAGSLDSRELGVVASEVALSKK